MNCCNKLRMFYIPFSLSLSVLLCGYLVAGCEEFECKSPGKFPHSDLTKYHECHFVGDNKFTHFEQSCPIDNCFKPISQSCEFSEGNCTTNGSEDTTQVGLFTCPTAGKFPHPDDSRKDAFFKCVEISGVLFAYEYQCLPTKPCFNPKTKMCEAGEPCNF